ncbi:MAG TPA: Gfo/Idh/MocA family oxidoreductase [Bacteroidales bacterium]|nr:Gfo/Idh/MocA family oxidoreductase [Bacteroidales bacterium]
MTNTNNSRRDFIKKAGLGASALAIGGIGFPASSYARIVGANERMNFAMIGCYRRFNAYMDSLPKLTDDINVVYVCDVDKIRMADAQAKVSEKMGYKPDAEEDLRNILEDKKVDAVVIAIPDHWHAPATFMAVKAGKHVYLEKPCSHNPREGELLVDFQKKYNRVIQMGSQQRSAIETREIISEIHKGLLGETYMGLAFYSNSRGKVPNPLPVNPPPTLNWELFQGPAPRAQYMDVYFDYNWHWFWQYGTGETGNNAVHELDICRWALELDFPKRVSVIAGKQHYRDDGWTMYDTMDASFIFPNGKVIKWDGKSRSNYQTYGMDRGSIIYGSQGTAVLNRNGYKVFDLGGKLLLERKSEEVAQTTQPGGAGGMDGLHIMNFVNTIRGTAPQQNQPITEGAKSTLLGHLANISYRVNAPLELNETNGHILNNSEAMKLWERQYEKGWEPKL